MVSAPARLGVARVGGGRRCWWSRRRVLIIPSTLSPHAPSPIATSIMLLASRPCLHPHSLRGPRSDRSDHQATSDKALGGAMLFVAAFVFTYYTIWALLLVSLLRCPETDSSPLFLSLRRCTTFSRPASGQSAARPSFSLPAWRASVPSSARSRWPRRARSARKARRHRRSLPLHNSFPVSLDRHIPTSPPLLPCTKSPRQASRHVRAAHATHPPSVRNERSGLDRRLRLGFQCITHNARVHKMTRLHGFVGF